MCVLQLKASVGAALNISEAQFLSFDPRFEELLGKHPKLEVLAERNYSFAHEAPVFLPKSNEVNPWCLEGGGRNLCWCLPYGILQLISVSSITGMTRRCGAYFILTIALCSHSHGAPN